MVAERCLYWAVHNPWSACEHHLAYCNKPLASAPSAHCRYVYLIEFLNHLATLELAEVTTFLLA